MAQKFGLGADDIKPLATGRGACLASDMITCDGKGVGFMYRATPDRPEDSGWRFMAGLEDQDYMDDPANHGVYDVNTIANYDPSIVPFLDERQGSVFERPPGAVTFRRVTDWEPPED